MDQLLAVAIVTKMQQHRCNNIFQPLNKPKRRNDRKKTYQKQHLSCLFFFSSSPRLHNSIHLNFELPPTKKHTYNSKNLTLKHQLAMFGTPL
jgi:hypothetical protein